jgi:alpha-glucosidase (family GH31 glycosyl hydrolase)
MAGAFYPFSRNHMTIFHLSRSHEPYQWKSVTAAHRKAYGLRYQLLTYIYSSLFVAHSRGGTLARPLLFTDSSDLAARNATQQWMLGESLLVSPVISPNTTKITPHFTAGTWYVFPLEAAVTAMLQLAAAVSSSPPQSGQHARVSYVPASVPLVSASMLRLTMHSIARA